MRPGDLTSLSSGAAWMVLVRAAATPARRRTGLLPGHASRNGSVTSAPPVAACGVTPGVARQNLDCRRRCRLGGGRTDGQLRCRRPARRCWRPFVRTPAPHSRPVQPAHRRLNRRCADARSVARSRGWLDLTHAVTGCGPWSARAAAVLLTLWVLGCSGARRGGCGVGRWCVPGPVPAIPARFRPACRNSAIRRSRSRLCWLYGRRPTRPTPTPRLQQPPRRPEPAH